MLEELRQTLTEMFADALTEMGEFESFDEVFELDTNHPFTDTGKFNLFLKAGSIVLQDATAEEVIDYIELWIEGYD